ncbi:hypothetical protein HacjB3_19328 (plasmid) [Halalkalicoccus jeotgali B3]|uniref:Uncharacterized protein n=1 Tax=Halalkalicoccus jeotgali (strain DSM 18796 / CECT 7217 / JCM 14584 / KCTC 4019 / B3) TaxID=795797 RepID=D8JCR3_HALJB|nr:hypothetical protein HacjB3_17328 [Halalkalicoccus jeotgali B3]ADJ17202.1 hypothetical protein HacjB3_19328 [Halalkalicoccus jeotgali B3]
MISAPEDYTERRECVLARIGHPLADGDGVIAR